jgi:hypothetical protein
MLIFFIFRSRYRRSHLNNFLKIKKIAAYRFINFSGPYLYLIGKLFILLKIGKGISCDGNPIINKKFGINFWMGGTNFKILSKFKNMKNNYVNMRSIFHNDEKIFQLYPLNIEKYHEQQKKIIYISDVKIIDDKNILQFWHLNKNQILNNFTLIDKLYFWKKFSFYDNKEKCFFYYRNIKHLLRFNIVKRLKKKYKENFILKGSNWSKNGLSSLPDDYDLSKNFNLYNSNICIDLGSISGSLSLYPRSINIIESGGLLIQQKQNDLDTIWKECNYKKIFFFKNYKSLLLSIDFFLNNNTLFIKYLEAQKKNFNNSKKLIEKQLKKILI